MNRVLWRDNETGNIEFTDYDTLKHMVTGLKLHFAMDPNEDLSVITDILGDDKHYTYDRETKHLTVVEQKT